MQQKIARESGIALLYVLIFCIVTYPLVLYFPTHIVGELHSDAPIFLWNVWEMQQQLAHHQLSWWTNDIFFPAHSSLLWHTYTPVQSVVALAINALAHNLVFSFNSVFLLSSVAAAYCAYRFFFLHLPHRGAAVIGGALFGFQSLWSVYAQFGTQNILSIWYISAALWCVALFCKTHRWYYAVLCGGIIGLAFVNDLYIFSMALLGVLGYATCATRVLHLLSLSWKKFFVCVLLICVGFGVAGGWKIADVVAQWGGSDIAIPSTADVDVYHADVVNLIRPTRFHPLFSGGATWFTENARAQGSAFVGFSVIGVLLCTLLVRWRTHKPLQNYRLLCVYGIGAAAALMYASGPFLHLFGIATGIPLPYDLLQWLAPPVRHVRVVLRWLLLFHFFFAGISTMCIAYCAAVLKLSARRTAWIVLLVVIVLDVAYLPRPLIAISDHIVDGYRAIAADERGGTVLSLPLEISSGTLTLGAQTHIELARQVIHGKPLIGGHLSRLPLQLQKNAAADPVLSYFLSPENGPSPMAFDPHTIQQFKNDTQLRYIAIEKNNSDWNSRSSHRLFSYITDTLLMHEYYDDSFVRIYVREE